MLTATLVIGVASTLWAERVMFGGGFGWDGQLYGAWVRDFYQAVVVDGLPRYYIQRMLPSAVVHYGMRLLGVPRGDAQILLAFDVYQVLLLLLSTYVWTLTARELRLRTPAAWFGYCSLFSSFAILKNTFYNPAQTDTTAFALGLLMFYFFLTDRPLGSLTVLVLGSFAWPTVPYMTALLYVCPRPPAPATPAVRPAVPSSATLAAVTSAIALALYVYLVTVRFSDRMTTFSWGVRIDTAVVYLSVGLVAAYLFVGIRSAAADDRLFAARRLLAAIRWRRVVVAAAMLGLLDVAQRALAGGRELEWATPRFFAMYTLMASLTEPLIFVVAHVVYYGPPILLLLLLWQPFCEKAGELGVGFRLFVLANVVLGLNPQSRYQINAVAAFVVVLVWMLDRRGLTYRALLTWLPLCVLYSKVWYPFNTAPQVYDGTMAILLRFPLQHYYMNAGPWMSHEMYLVQGGIVLYTAALLYWLVGRHLFGAIRGRASAPAEAAAVEAMI